MRVAPTHPSVPHVAFVSLGLHAVAGWALAFAPLLLLDGRFAPFTESVLYALAAPGAAALVALFHFARPDAAEPLVGAAVFTAVATALDLGFTAAGAGPAHLDPVLGYGVPLLLTFGAVGLAGELLPLVRRRPGAARR